jgi:hypothetical protein
MMMMEFASQIDANSSAQNTWEVASSSSSSSSSHHQICGANSSAHNIWEV